MSMPDVQKAIAHAHVIVEGLTDIFFAEEDSGLSRPPQEKIKEAAENKCGYGAVWSSKPVVVRNGPLALACDTVTLDMTFQVATCPSSGDEIIFTSGAHDETFMITAVLNMFKKEARLAGIHRKMVFRGEFFSHFED